MRGLWVAVRSAMGRLRGPRARPGAVTREELEFSSEFDEFVNTPPPRTAKWLIRLICLSFLGFLVWLVTGELDVSASASGEIRPVSEVVAVQSQVSGTVVGLEVEENKFVVSGDVLIELDATSAAADLERVLVLEEQARLDVASAEALAALAADPGGPLPSLPAAGSVAGIDAEEIARRQSALERRHAEIGAALSRIEAQVAESDAGRSAEMRQAGNLRSEARRARDRAEIDGRARRGEIGVLVELRGIAEDELGRQETLFERGVVAAAAVDGARQQALEAGQRVSEARAGLALMEEAASSEAARLEDGALAAEDRAAGHEARRETLGRERELLLAGIASEAAEAEVEAQARLRGLVEERTKAQARLDAHTVTAPATGSVVDLQINAAGAVVMEGQPLLVIVPQGVTLQAEVFIENKDLAHVEIGQDVVIKLDAFPHIDYGTIEGTLVDIAADATRHEQLGSAFKAVIELRQTSVQVGDRAVPLRPGMRVTAEITTGTRRPYEYFLEPVLERLDESLDER